MRISNKTEAISSLCFEDRCGEWEQLASLKLSKRKIAPLSCKPSPDLTRARQIVSVLLILLLYSLINLHVSAT